MIRIVAVYECDATGVQYVAVDAGFIIKKMTAVKNF
jgi:hypothetical protein